jgi:hypothetical protein
MYSRLRKILSGALIALLMFVVIFQAAMAEDQMTAEEASPAEVQVAETSAEPDSQPLPEPSAQAEPQAAATMDEQLVSQPEAEATIGPEMEATAEPELFVEIPDEQVPLAGGQEPSVTVLYNRDINALQIGDNLVLTSELAGFSGMEYSIRWQARVDGQWKDIEGEHSTKLIIKITGDNADWSYRAAVDAQPVK